MKKRKKFIFSLVCLGIALSMNGCGESKGVSCDALESDSEFNFDNLSKLDIYKYLNIALKNISKNEDITFDKLISDYNDAYNTGDMTKVNECLEQMGNAILQGQLMYTYNNDNISEIGINKSDEDDKYVIDMYLKGCGNTIHIKNKDIKYPRTKVAKNSADDYIDVIECLDMIHNDEVYTIDDVDYVMTEYKECLLNEGKILTVTSNGSILTDYKYNEDLYNKLNDKEIKKKTKKLF